jgi:hypothetical protein
VKTDTELRLRYTPPQPHSICAWCGTPLAGRAVVPRADDDRKNGDALVFFSARCSAKRHQHVQRIELTTPKGDTA